MRMISQDHYRGYRINIGKFKNMRCYKVILDRIIDEVEWMLSQYSRLNVIRLDLQFPQGFRKSVSEENTMVSHFIKLVKDNLSYERWGPHIEVGHGWVLEKGSSNSYHYHMMLVMKYTQRSLGCFKQGDESGLWKMLLHCAEISFGGSLHFAGRHVLDRGDEAKIEKCIYHLSYMAKESTKYFRTNETHRRYRFSQRRRRRSHESQRVGLDRFQGGK